MSVHIRRVVGLSMTIVMFSACHSKVDTIKPEMRSISESVYASVVIQPYALYDVHSASSGIIERILIEEGDTVRSGDILVEIKSIDPKLNLETARVTYDLANEQLKGDATTLQSLEEEIGLMRVQVELDSHNYARQSRLWEQEIGSRTVLENAELKYEASLSKLESLRTQYQRTEKELTSARERAGIGVKQAEALLQQFTVECKIDGCVYDLLKDEGEQVMVQEPIARVGHCDSFIIEMLIDEVDIARVRHGQKVLVRLDAFEDEIFEGSVNRIYPSKNMQTQTFKVEAEFLTAPPILYAGLAGEANIIIAVKDSALTIPIEYVFDQNRLMTQDGEVTVETGLRNFDYVEILRGIDTATVVLKPKVE